MSASSLPATEPLHDPWRHRSFLKDAKIRARERYFSSNHDRALVDDKVAEDKMVLLPDAITWRKYLGLIEKLVSFKQLQWILLESTTELMDHYNQKGEKAAPQERNKLLQMVQAGQVTAFCDCSVREADDEWDFMSYENLDVESRSQLALIRAARMIQGKETCVICETENPLSEEEGIELFPSISHVLDRLVDKNVVNRKEFDLLKELQHACETAHLARNTSYQQDCMDANTALVWTDESIQIGLKDGALLRGRLNVSKDNPKEAFVSVGSETYFVDGNQGHFGQSFHQDIIILHPLPKENWGRPLGKQRIVHYRGNDDTEDDQVVMNIEGPTFRSGRVVRVAKPGRRIFIATMVDQPTSDESAVLVVPMDIRVPKIRIHTRAWQKFVGCRLKVEVDAWDADSNYPHGRCVDVIGKIGDLETEIKALLVENEVDLEPFSREALACLPPQGEQWQVSEEEVTKRRDLRRSRRVFSVDPPGCQDIDDTMHVERLPNGDVEVGVHIADVTHFVQHNSPLDLEAQKRGTTFYLVDRRFDMLPSLLSSNLCSLHGGTDRLAVSVIWTFSPDFKQTKSTWYGRTVIHNIAAMTYDQADNILHNQVPENPNSKPVPALTDGSPVDKSLIPTLKEDLTTLTKLARKLKVDREEFGGAVDLSSGDTGTELKFTLVDGVPVKVIPKEEKEIHNTIEELMIMANSFVATKINQAFADSALLRVHQAAQEDRFQELREVMEKFGIDFRVASNKELAQSLKGARGLNPSWDSVLSSLVTTLATRAMTEAQYVCVGQRKDGVNLSHYGLGLEKYTHFTSPIRRYADVVVHKQLLATLSIETSPRLDWLPEQNVLSAVPESNVVSVLRGEGLDALGDLELDGEDFLDSLIEGASDQAFGIASVDKVDSAELQSSVTELCSSIKPYTCEEVVRICDGLNIHHRLAKQSSYECQKLFLSLFFREHTEVCKAVVTSLRSNGFWVYVPKYDLRGPVYLKDLTGCIQMDPVLLRLPLSAGFPATLGFAASGRCRRLPDAKIDFVQGENERLVVTEAENAFEFVVRPLDVVTVEISCFAWDIQARVPSPRFNLVSGSTRLSHTATKVHEISKDRSESSTKHHVGIESVPRQTQCESIASILSAFVIKPILFHDGDHPPRSVNPQHSYRQEYIRGRINLNSFVNPDTRSFAQAAAQRSAALDMASRRSYSVETKSTRFDVVSNIEKQVTSRQQRLASEKRNARKGKAHKS